MGSIAATSALQAAPVAPYDCARLEKPRLQGDCVTGSPSDNQGNQRLRIATLRSLTGGALESSAPESEVKPARRELVNPYNRVVQKNQVQTPKNRSHVKSTVQAPDPS